MKMMSKKVKHSNYPARDDHKKTTQLVGEGAQFKMFLRGDGEGEVNDVALLSFDSHDV